MGGKGILLYSGGLDSLLAARVLLDQGLDLAGIHFILPFFSPDERPEESAAARRAEKIGLQLRHFRLGKDYMEMAKDPPHGYGKKMNPCIDCKIFFLRRARELMIDEGASFVATGEVVGQRPMSQMRHMLNHIEKESGLKGYLLRPLSAKLMKPTHAELGGIVDREKLLAINGRGRFAQAELAKKYAITDYATPAGGCLFTDAFIARRVKDLFDHTPGFSMTDSYLLVLGRHFRLRPGLKFIVGRNEAENLVLEKYRDEADSFIIPDFRGPSLFVRGEAFGEDVALAGKILARYGKADGLNSTIRVFRKGADAETVSVAGPAGNEIIDMLRI